MSETNTESGSGMPDRLGFYEVAGKLGQGGMAVVYKGVQSSLNRAVAIKVLPPQFATTPELLARFDREAAIVAKLTHSNIVQVIDRGRQDNLLYIVMEYVEGQSLDKVIQSGGLSLSLVIDYASQICDGLDYAHKAGVVHRDLKPANILVDQRTGRVKIADFGIASLETTDSGLATLTVERSAIGTMNYMSPEQRVDSHRVTASTDIFSLGVILYEMLTGKIPVGRYKAPSMIRQDIPLGFDTIVNRCLAESPSDRYTSAGQVRDELQSLTVRRTAPRSFSVLGRFNKRQQGVAMAGVAGVVLLIIVAIAAVVGHFRKSRMAGGVFSSSEEASAIGGMQMQADYSRAMGLLHDGKREEAISILKGLLQKDPRNSLAPELQFTIAMAYGEMADHERSILEIDRLIRNYPQSPRIPEAMIEKCKVEWGRGRQRRILGSPVWDAQLQKRLIAELQEVLGKRLSDANAVSALKLLATIAEMPMLADSKVAADALMKLCAYKPEEAADVMFHAAELYDQRGNEPALARQTYERFVREFSSDRRVSTARNRLEVLSRKN
jgi:predicted Ser/Thr protein kinase